MQVNIITIFPGFFDSPLKVSLLGKAVADRKIEITLHNLRDFAVNPPSERSSREGEAPMAPLDVARGPEPVEGLPLEGATRAPIKAKHSKVDDLPYGGGAGMVFKPEPLVRAIQSIPKKEKSLSILLSPRGKPLTQEIAKALIRFDQLILVCGRYEGVDERVRELVIDEEISIGDYILNGGESAALVLIDTLVRLIPGVLGNEASLGEESFAQGLLEYPQYTRPPEFQGLKVPEVLLKGHHQEIIEWRKEKALEITKQRRPDLLKKLL